MGHFLFLMLFLLNEHVMLDSLECCVKARCVTVCSAHCFTRYVSVSPTKHSHEKPLSFYLGRANWSCDRQESVKPYQPIRHHQINLTRVDYLAHRTSAKTPFHFNSMQIKVSLWVCLFVPEFFNCFSLKFDCLALKSKVWWLEFKI